MTAGQELSSLRSFAFPAHLKQGQWMKKLAQKKSKHPQGMDRDGLVNRVLDAVPSPFFVVDEDMRLLAFNAAATAMVKQRGEVVYRRRGGEAFHCVHSADSPEGCGRGPACEDCIIRNSVTASMHGRKTTRCRTVLETVKGRAVQSADILLTSSPFDYGDRRLVLLMLEDISELATLRKLIPICANCKKVRDDDDYWRSVETYFTTQLKVDFSHGICPECAEKLYPDIWPDLPLTR